MSPTQAWAARGKLDRAAEIVARITDEEERATIEVAVAIAAGEVAALPARLAPLAAFHALEWTGHELARWKPQEHEPAFADAFAERLDDGSGAWARLKIWAAVWPALSASKRAGLASRIEQAVEAVLAEDDRNDDALCAIAEHLPERLLVRIWEARASAAAYRHALALYEKRFCEFMLAGDFRHPAVLHFLLALGGEDALFEHARWVAGAE
jgi:hypothetical protein